MAPEIKITGSDPANQRSVLVLPAALQQLVESGDLELVEELIAIFQTDTAERLETLRRAAAAGDYRAAGAEAHTVKGSSAQVGAIRLADVCLQIEREARKVPLADLGPLVDRAFASFDEVCRLLAARSGPGFPVVSVGD